MASRSASFFGRPTPQPLRLCPARLAHASTMRVTLRTLRCQVNEQRIERARCHCFDPSTTLSRTGSSRVRIVLVRRFLPILRLAPAYDRRWLRGDVAAGIAVTALVVPKNLGYAGIAGVPLQNGLYAAAAGALIYALFCTSRQISTGPSSSLAAVAGGAVLVTGLGGDAGGTARRRDHAGDGRAVPAPRGVRSSAGSRSSSRRRSSPDSSPERRSTSSSASCRS